MPSTPNFGWTTPADTDLVRDGASAIRTLAGEIDTSVGALSVQADSFAIIAALAVPYSNVNFNTHQTDTSSYYLSVALLASSAQNDEVVFLLPTPLRGGTWTLSLAYRKGTSAGIYTIAASPDAATWTDLTTVDGYAAAGVNAVTDAAGLTVAAGTKFLRLKMATKNASSSAYQAELGLLSGVRTGA